jgi:predicted phosphodiesterase
VKILVLSDIHSNILALKAIQEQEKHTDFILVAGDLVDYGPFPREVIQWMRREKALVVKGNHDRRLTETFYLAACREKPGPTFKWIHDNCLKLAEEDIRYLESLPDSLNVIIDGIAYTMRHEYNGYDTIQKTDDFDSFIREYGEPDRTGRLEQRIIFGHTHRRCVHYLTDQKLWLNPGSVSYRRPDDTDKSAHYIVIDGGHIFLKHIVYDRSPLLKATKEYLVKRTMMYTELQDAFFFFGDAATSREPLCQL